MVLEGLIELLFPAQCGGCSEPGSGLCATCLPPGEVLRSRLPTLEVAALGAYHGGLRRAVVALKSGRRDVARACAQRLIAIVPAGATLIPVPTTPARRRQRGFDGCEWIAQLVASSGRAVVCAGLRQTRGDRQRGRGRDARLRARGRFCWRGDPICGRTAVLLDDVATTGSTLEDCAATLRAAGAIVHQAIVIARA